LFRSFPMQPNVENTPRVALPALTVPLASLPTFSPKRDSRKNPELAPPIIPSLTRDGVRPRERVRVRDAGSGVLVFKLYISLDFRGGPEYGRYGTSYSKPW
jgi:hypothetical protein